MRAYRVENADGNGPWKGNPCDEGESIGDWCEQVGLDRVFHNEFPCARDIFPVQLGHYVSGFENLNQVDSWFSPRLRLIMRAKGYRLNVYEIPESLVHRHHTQLAILGNHWRENFIETLDLVSFLPLNNQQEHAA